VPCTITITSVNAQQLIHYTPTVCDTFLALAGTVTGPAACPEIQVKADCNGATFSGTVNTSGVLSGSAISGSLVTSSTGGQNWQLVLQITCCCDTPKTPLTVTVSCPTLGCSETKQFPALPCQSDCCPHVSTLVTPGVCDGAGHMDMTFTVTATQASGCSPYQIQLDFGDGSQTYTASSNFTVTHNYSSGTHTAYINTISPPGCPQIQVPVNVPCPPKGCCPTITTTVEYGKCHDGKALVTFNVTVVPVAAAGCPSVQGQLDFGDGSSPLSFSSSFVAQHPYSGGPQTAFINITSPTGCPQIKIPLNVPCPPCCPNVSITPCIPDCDSSASRQVRFDITVTPAPPPCPALPISFQMDFGDGATGSLQTSSGTSPYSYTEYHPYTGSAALSSNTAALQIIKPSQCAGSYAPQVIPACCKPKRAKWGAILFWTMSFAFAFALLFLLFALLPASMSCATCLPFTTQPGYTPLNAFYFFAIIGVVALILYLLFCTKCRCGWLYLLLWRILSGAGLLYFIFAACSLGIISVIIGLVLILLGYLLLQQWRKQCCVTWCHFLGEILLWFVYLMSIASVLIANNIASGCVYTLFSITILTFTIKITTYDVAVAVLAWFVTYYKKHCGKHRVTEQ